MALLDWIANDKTPEVLKSSSDGVEKAREKVEERVHKGAGLNSSGCKALNALFYAKYLHSLSLTLAVGRLPRVDD